MRGEDWSEKEEENVYLKNLDAQKLKLPLWVGMTQEEMDWGCGVREYGSKIRFAYTDSKHNYISSLKNVYTIRVQKTQLNANRN